MAGYCLCDQIVTQYLGLVAVFRSRPLRVGTRTPTRLRGLSENGLQTGDELDGGTERRNVSTIEIGSVAHAGNKAELKP